MCTTLVSEVFSWNRFATRFHRFARLTHSLAEKIFQKNLWDHVSCHTYLILFATIFNTIYIKNSSKLGFIVMFLQVYKYFSYNKNSRQSLLWVEFSICSGSMWDHLTRSEPICLLSKSRECWEPVKCQKCEQTKSSLFWKKVTQLTNCGI